MGCESVDLVTVFDAILRSRQTREKLQCLYENLMLNNFRKTAVLEKRVKFKSLPHRIILTVRHQKFQEASTSQMFDPINIQTICKKIVIL